MRSTDFPIASIVDIEPHQAEWALQTVADLFEYFIIRPAHDAKLMKQIDEKLAQTERKPIKPLDR